jgi:tRNA(Ile)-lysidine synthase
MDRKVRDGKPLRPLARLAADAIFRYGLLESGESVLVAVSGGADSVALLHVLGELLPAFRLRLGVAHFNHALRPEADRDAEFVAELAAGLGLPFHVERVDVQAHRDRAGGSLEETARELRYRFLDTVAAAAGYTRIALGHHADDNAETLLLNLLRGGGRRGMAGIAPFRPPGYIRPLILARRADIERYLDLRRQAYRTDATNADPAFDRNRIRRSLIPELERRYQPKARIVLSRAAEILRAEEEWLEELVAPIYAAAKVARDSGVGLRVSALRGLAPAALRRVVRRALCETRQGLRGIGFEHVERVVDLLGRRHDAGPLYLPGGLRVGRGGDGLHFWLEEGRGARTPARVGGGDYEYAMARLGRLKIPEAGVEIALSEVAGGVPSDWAAGDARTALFDGEGIGFPILVRNSRPGDRFSPLGVDGTQKLKKFFCDHKIPPVERQRCPLLVSRGRIIWVAGHRIDSRSRVTALTRRLLKAELIIAPQ